MRRRQVRLPVLTVRDGRVAALAGAGLPPAVRTALDELRADLQQRPFDAPEAARLAELGLGPRQLASLVRNGELLRVADGVVLLPGADDRAVAVLATLGPEFTLSAARQALGTSRRVAVPLLELLARTGRTERTADGGHRLVGPADRLTRESATSGERMRDRALPQVRIRSPEPATRGPPPGSDPTPRWQAGAVGSTVTRDVRHAPEPARRSARRPAER